MNKSKEQIEEWLDKLERESWQLELLVSAFTIFLLLGALSAYDELLTDIQFQYNLNVGLFTIVYIFLILLKNSLLALIISLIIHLSLRGFWIGAIGLRSVQSDIDFSKLNYTEFFTEKIRKRVISLDQLVIKLDEICSVIFAFSFLVISVLLAFGMYMIFISVLGIAFSAFVNLFSGIVSTIILGVSVIIILTCLITGMIYMIDYFSLGFFKKIKWFSKVYYPFYRLYNVITLSTLSRSIYYYLISKFTKRKIRMVYAVFFVIISVLILFDFDQQPYYPETNNMHSISSNFYDDVRPEGVYINSVSIESNYIDKPHFQVFLRYDPVDNNLIRNNCPNFTPLREDGINWAFTTTREGANFQIGSVNYSDEDIKSLLDCQSSIYQLIINDSVYQDLSFYFYEHPSKSQKGLLTTIPTSGFRSGENILKVNKVRLDSAKVESITDYVKIPFWFRKE
jgi:hypothetical protein